MAKSYGGSSSSVTITSALASDPTTGVVELTLTDTQTENLDAPARYVYDVYITQASTSTVTRVIEGVIAVNLKSIISFSSDTFRYKYYKRERNQWLKLVKN